MSELCPSDQCTSCMACFNACPFGAINISETSLSAKVPSVDTDKCRNCGLCEKSCPIINKRELRYPRSAVALYTKDPVDVCTCASGGAATVFSRNIILEGGVVYGATAVGGYPKFIRIDELSGLDKLKGSKYVYCDPQKIYCAVKSDLKSRRKCLFVGTPCDVAGLLNYLGKKYDELYTIDLICHGTPPFEYLLQHLKNKGLDISNIGNITFRGNIDFHTVAYDKKGKIVYKCNQYEDEYFTAFMKGVMFRPVCYECQFACSERVSDITIGDFWGAPNAILNGYNGKISVALLNTEKGLKIFDDVKADVNWEYRDVNEVIVGNCQLREPSAWNKNAAEFYYAYKKSHSVSVAFKNSGIADTIRKNKVRRYLLAIPKLIRNLISNICKYQLQ